MAPSRRRELPVRLAVAPDAAYSRDDSRVAVPLSKARARGLICDFVLEEERVGIVAADEWSDAADALPVYRNDSGAAFVPTGRLFVRFEEGESAATHRSELSDAGFQIEEVPKFAPHAAWVRSADGSAVTALEGMSRLQGIPGVKRVEPQLLSPAARKAKRPRS